jgi:hypothetical protein
MVLFRPDDYASFNQELAWELLAAISIDEGRFLEIARACFGPCHEAAAAPGAASAAGGAGRRCSDCGAAVELVAGAAGGVAVADS